MRLKIILGGMIIALLLCYHNGICASDGFSAVRCGSDIPAKLIGKTMTNERVVVIENRHKDLGLKDLGGSEISERLFLTSWQICGDEYVLLEEKGTVRDVLKFPPHSKITPQFIGTCEIRGHESFDSIIAVLDSDKQSDGKLPAKVAWKIDEKRKKFIEVPIEGLLCPKSGVITADGGL